MGSDGEGFAFDNEGPRHEVYLQAVPPGLAAGDQWRVSRIHATTAAIGKAELWLSDGWDCVRNNQWSAPLYWEQRDGEWWHYTIEGMQPVELNAAGVPRQLLRGRRLCALGGRAAADRVRVGSRSAGPAAWKAICWRAGRLHPRLPDDAEPA